MDSVKKKKAWVKSLTLQLNEVRIVAQGGRGAASAMAENGGSIRLASELVAEP